MKSNYFCVGILLLVVQFFPTSVFAEIPYEDNFLSLYNAVLRDDFETVKQCVTKNPAAINDWRIKDELQSPLFASITYERKQCFDYFMEHGGNPNQYWEWNGVGRTITMVASGQPDPYYLQRLIELGADLAFESKDGTTALHVAISYGPKNYDVLMKNMPNIEREKEKNDRSAYIFNAIETRNSGTVQKIIKDGFTVDAMFEDGTNAVDYIFLTSQRHSDYPISNNYIEMCKMLYRKNPALFTNRKLAVRYWRDSWVLLTQIQLQIYDVFNEQDEKGECFLTDILKMVDTTHSPDAMVLRLAIRFGLDVNNFSYNGLGVYDYCKSIGYSENNLRRLKETFIEARIFDKTLPVLP